MIASQCRQIPECYPAVLSLSSEPRRFSVQWLMGISVLADQQPRSREKPGMDTSQQANCLSGFLALRFSELRPHGYWQDAILKNVGQLQ